MMGRTERESDTCIFLQNELQRIRSGNLEEAELVAIFNFYEAVLELEKKFQPVIQQYQDFIKDSQISPDAFSKVTSCLPVGLIL